MSVTYVIDSWGPGSSAPTAPHELPECVAEQVDAHRTNGVQLALAYLHLGKASRARREMELSVLAQARVAGVFGDLSELVGCPCGGRCATERGAS